MDAQDRTAGSPAARRLKRFFLILTIKSALLVAGSVYADAAAYKTANFVVQAPNDDVARQVGETAETWRKRLALKWLGEEMPDWQRRCSVRVRVGQIGAGGATTFSFDRGHVFGWKMQVQGTLERILDSVVPHEVSHTVFATHFRRPLPRWADEGAATLVEHDSEQRVQQLRLKQVLDTRQRIPFRRLLSMKDYPSDMQQVLVLYAEGYSLADYLVQKKGRTTFLKFLDDAHRNGWDRALIRHYGVKSVETLEKNWKGWFLAGSPRLNLKEGEMLAGRDANRESAPGRRDVVIRSQSPDAETTATESAAGPVAPDPRRGERKHATSSASSFTQVAPTSGRRRALNDGWVPVIRNKVVQSAATDNADAENGDSDFEQRTDEDQGRSGNPPQAEQ